MSALNTLVDETTTIKNELITCYTNLKNNLIGKGVECSDKDKIEDLINKVPSISTGKKWASGVSTVENQGIYANIFGGPEMGSRYVKRISLPSLDFKPRVVIAHGLWYKYRYWGAVLSIDESNPFCYAWGSVISGTNDSPSYRFDPFDKNFGFIDGVYKAPALIDTTNGTFNWIAFE